MSWTSGLPPVAAERIARAQGSHVAGSLFSAPAAAAARMVGLEPVGEAMGLTVQHIPWGYYSCGGYGTPYQAGPFAPINYTPRVLTSGTPDGRLNRGGWSERVQALYQGWDTALNRLLAEAEGLRAHGVIGVRLEQTRIDTAAHEFRALGTAVRWEGIDADPEPGRWQVFATELTAEDVTTAVLNGWLPRGIAVGLSISVRHDDWVTRNQASSWQNQELDGLTRLLTMARHDARDQLHARAARLGGEQVVISSMTTELTETKCSNGGQDAQDHVASVRFIGTALARDPLAARALADRPRTLTVMPLTGRGSARSRRENR